MRGDMTDAPADGPVVGTSVSHTGHPPILPAAPAAPTAEASDLIRFAIERKVDVEVLERLVALQERVTERNARAAYFEALASFQEAVPEIRRSKTAKIASRGGAAFSYTYAPLEEITRTIRPALRTYGLSYAWDVAEGNRSLLVTCVVRHVEGHEERSSFPVPIDSEARMSDAQKNGAALTYGRRQSLIAVLGLTTADEDPDGAETVDASTISESQAADLEVLMAEVRIDRRRFLGWLGVTEVGQILKADYARAVRTLEERR